MLRQLVGEAVELTECSILVGCRSQDALGVVERR